MEAARWFGLVHEPGRIWLRFLTLSVGFGWRFGGRPIVWGVTLEPKMEDWGDRLMLTVALWPLCVFLTLDRIEELDLE